MTAHTESRREPLPGALTTGHGLDRIDLLALRDAVVLLLERHETIAFNEWSGDGFGRLQAALTALGGKHRINRSLGSGTHAPGRDPLCAVCVETAGKERLLAAVDEPPTAHRHTYSNDRQDGATYHCTNPDCPSASRGGYKDEPGDCTCSPQAETPCVSLDCIIVDKPVAS